MDAAGNRSSVSLADAKGDPSQLSWDAATEQMYLILFGTGRSAKVSSARASLGRVAIPVAGPLPQGQFAGLDPLNFGPLPSSLRAKGRQTLVLDLDGREPNRLLVNFR